jgi:hypothetical protein
MFPASETPLNAAAPVARKNRRDTIAAADSCFPFDGISASTAFH